jgi:protein-S-isoprenylcysteine O-methyltransferase Ste14
MYSKIISILALGVAIAGFLLLDINHYLFSSNPAAIAVQVCAGILMAWARITFGLRSFHGAANTTKGKLVTSGPYRWMRNPIYTAIILFIWGCVISYPYMLTVGVAIAVTISMTIRALMEEKFLMVTYPEYSEYAGRTKRFIPFIL